MSYYKCNVTDNNQSCNNKHRKGNIIIQNIMLSNMYNMYNNSNAKSHLRKHSWQPGGSYTEMIYRR